MIKMYYFPSRMNPHCSSVCYEKLFYRDNGADCKSANFVFELLRSKKLYAINNIDLKQKSNRRFMNY